MASAAVGVHGFPAPLTSFVGRVAAVAEVAGLLGEYRLVTVTGPGGVGKTRLAGEVARQLAGRFADGAWLAELAPVADPAHVAAAVAAALRVRGRPGIPTAATLERVLSRQQVLLVLDSCEHVIDAAAALCAGLLAACDDVRILATSREALRAAGEVRYRLEPLSLPGPDDTHFGGSEAVALFADRACRVDPHFSLDGETGPVVARLVSRLDGMPLAIELAAARVEALGVAQLLDRIDDRFTLLTAGDRLAAGRQQSLAATVEWSYQLLDEPERRVFRWISVFPGQFTLEAAEAVAGAGAGPAVLDLVDCSLLSPPRAGPDGRSRYVMLETLRAYGARLLADAGEDSGAAAILAGYALRVADEASVGLQANGGEAAAARLLDAEDATMRQVLSWAVQHDPASALRLAVALAPWWLLRGRLASEYPLLSEAADRIAPGGQAWCAAQFWLGEMALHSGDLAGALGHLTALRDAMTDQPPSRALADCLAIRSVTLSNLGRIAEAADDGHRALALAQELGYPAGEALALYDLAVAAQHADDCGGAVRLARQAQQIPADIPGRRARECSSTLTNVLTAAGDLTAAEGICEAGLARSREAGDLENLSELLTGMADLDLRAGRIQDAAAHLRESLQITARTGGWLELLSALDRCGHLCAATTRWAEAVTVWAAYAALLQHEGSPDVPAESRRRHQPLRAARQALGPARAREAEDRGAAMSLAAAAEYALLLTAPGPQLPTTALPATALPATALPGQAAPAAALPAAASGLGQLSARERELITLVAQGRTNAQIAAQLYISVRTVSSHLDRIRDKTGCRRRADLTRLALTVGLV